MKSIEKEKEIRLRPQWNFVLPMEMKTSNIYYEKLLKGRSFDRLKKKKVRNIHNEIEKIIIQIQKEKRSTINSIKYSLSLKNTIVDELSKVIISKQLYLNVIEFVEHISDLVGDFDLEVSFSHGDLQYGNIFITENDEIYILDWETYSVRSIGYDLLTYFYRFRYRNNFIDRIKDFLNDNHWIEIANKFYTSTINKKQVLLIYLLEDINWIINESLNTANKKASPSLLLYSNRKFFYDIFEFTRNDIV
jgi:thiamine kinase-like enzyme